ncbi:Nuclear control of ATPase protein 2 [Rhynchospora pubera]|uniref:Nuclear control of ATPase protein 2 n=1 Tax=Rhynchospora pubera TaxID=906938 RepID=A0AAV8EPM1_9POAL|nr:Nuclear control of ATPase protein 2 [Rhynchospora pubera]
MDSSTSPDTDPTADTSPESDRKPLEIVLSYPGRIWRAVAGTIPSPDPNLLSKIRIPTLSGLSGLGILLRPQRRRHGLPLPLHSTSAHSFRVLGDASKSLSIIEEIVEHTLSHLHTIQKSLLFWQSRAEGTSSQKIYFMVFERGPRAFAKEIYQFAISLTSQGSSIQYLSDSASEMISIRLAILTSLQHSLSTFLAEVYLEANQYRDVLTEGSEKSLTTALVLIDGLFSKLEASLSHASELKKDDNSIAPQFQKLPQLDTETPQWTEAEINTATNLIYQNLQSLNLYLSSLLSACQKPKNVTTHWVRYTAGAVGLSACSIWLLKHSRLMGSSDIDNWIKDAKESMSLFWKEHVETPLISIRDELFETFKTRQTGGIDTEVQLNTDALRRMLIAFCEQTKGQKLPLDATDQQMMEIVMARYEKEMMHPVQNLFNGELARAMLIQIQRLKLDLETAMLELDQILKANQINFATLAALPACFIIYLLISVMRAWLLHDKGVEGRGTIARRQRRLLLVEVEKRLMQFQACMDSGMDEEARCRFGLMLYSLDRLYKAVEWHAKETGEWMSLKHDIVDIAKPDMETAQKLTVVSRVERMYDCLLPSSKRL